MDRKRKIGFLVFMVVFLGAAIVIPLLQNQQPAAKDRKPHAILSDGREIVLLAVTFGTNHQVSIRQDPKNSLARALPKFMHPMFGGRNRHHGQTERNEVLVPWLIVPPAPGSKSTPKMGGFSMVSQDGISLSIGGRSTSSLEDGKRLVRSTVHAFPRRDQYFTLTGTVDRLPFSIPIKNPIFGRKFPTWTPRSFPATNVAGDYRFILGEPGLHEQTRGGYLSAKLQIFHRGKPVDDWFRTHFDLSDPTGNRSFTLSTNETSWKTHFQMWKTFIGPWNTNDFRDFPLSDLPTATNHFTIPVNDVINGFKFGRIWIGGPGKYRFENGLLTKASRIALTDREKWNRQSGSHGWSMDWSRHEHWLLIEMDRWPRHGQELSVFVRDSRGKDVRVESRGWSGGGGISTGTFILKPSWADILAARKKPTKSTKLQDLMKPPLTLRIGVQTNMQTEFIVDVTKLKRLK